MNEYHLQWESPSLPYYWNHHFSYVPYYDRLIENIMGFQENDFLVVNDVKGYAFFLPESEIENKKRHSLAFFLDETKYRDWIENIEKFSNLLETYQWEPPLFSFSTKVLVEYIKELEDIFHHCVALHLVSQPHLTKALVDEIAFNSSKKRELFDIATLPSMLPKVLQEQKEWYVLCERALKSNGSLVKSLLSDHLKKWKYITAGDSNQPMNMAFLTHRLNESMSSPEIIKTNIKTISMMTCAPEERQKMMKEFTEYEAGIISLISEISYKRFVTKALWMKVWYLLEISMTEFIKRNDLSSYGFDFILEEFFSSSMNKDNNRKTYLMICKNSKFSLFYNGLDKIYVDQYLNKVRYDEIEVVKGDAGYCGQCEGRVVKIGWGDSIQKKIKLIDSDTILVVPQTTPAFMMAISSCKAIIVDEGGITSHASIISRELKKICILNTHIGTKVFSDGDLVNVMSSYDDAHAKIISRARRP